MRGKRTDLPSTRKEMEEYLLEAWTRVKEGRPNNPRLVELRKKGRLKVTISSVAEEAGVSRTLIAFDGCRYPDVRQKILGVSPAGEDIPVRIKTNMREVNNDLREINRILEQRLKVSLSEQAAVINRMMKLEAEYDDKVGEIRRINARGKRSPNEIVGLHIVKPDD